MFHRVVPEGATILSFTKKPFQISPAQRVFVEVIFSIRCGDVL
jgi:hypothetical protein